MIDRRLAMAALDPNAALEASTQVPAVTPVTLVVAPRPIVVESEAVPAGVLVVDIEVRKKPISRWRFLVFWILIKLAARVYRFNFEIHEAPLPPREPSQPAPR